jgi:hypothetical protein
MQSLHNLFFQKFIYNCEIFFIRIDDQEYAMMARMEKCHDSLIIVDRR